MEMSSVNAESERDPEDDWIHLDLLKGADPTRNHESGTIDAQVSDIRKMINEKYDLFKHLKETEAFKKAQADKADTKLDIKNFIPAAE